MSAQDEFLEKLNKLSVHQRGNERAPHKPLYFLLLLSGLQRGEERLRTFSELRKPLRDALGRFGLRTKSLHPEYPFWWLRSDGISEVLPSAGYETRRASNDPKMSSLLAEGAKGGLVASYFYLLRDNMLLQSHAIHTVLDGHFPRSIHDEILEHFELRLLGPHAKDKATDADFRRAVIAAYEFRCAATGFHSGVLAAHAGVEAAHICWPQAGGNDDVSNGIALSTLHRKLFHLGILGLDSDYRVLVSPDALNGKGSVSARGQASSGRAAGCA